MISDEEYYEGFSDDLLAEEKASFMVWKLLNPETHIVVWRERMSDAAKQPYRDFAWKVKMAFDA